MSFLWYRVVGVGIYWSQPNTVNCRLTHKLEIFQVRQILSKRLIYVMGAFLLETCQLSHRREGMITIVHLFVSSGVVSDEVENRGDKDGIEDEDGDKKRDDKSDKSDDGSDKSGDGSDKSGDGADKSDGDAKNDAGDSDREETSRKSSEDSGVKAAKEERERQVATLEPNVPSCCLCLVFFDPETTNQNPCSFARSIQADWVTVVVT